VVDSNGVEQINVEDTLTKTGIPSDIEGLRPGCRVRGKIVINKVASNVHFALGRGMPGTSHDLNMEENLFQYSKLGALHDHQFNYVDLQRFNASHIIHYLSFGPRYPSYPRQPLDGVTKIAATGIAQYNYFISVVPTRYQHLDGGVLFTNQYSYTEKIIELVIPKGTFPHPGIFFHLSISPLLVKITEKKSTFFSFFTQLCGIVGSIWVVSSFIASILNQISQSNGVQWFLRNNIK